MGFAKLFLSPLINAYYCPACGIIRGRCAGKPLGQTLGQKGFCQVSAAGWRVGNPRKMRVIQEGASKGKRPPLVDMEEVSGSNPL